MSCDPVSRVFWRRPSKNSNSAWRPRFDRYVSLEQRKELLADIESVASWVVVSQAIAARTFCRDPADDKFIHAALATGPYTDISPISRRRRSGVTGATKQLPAVAADRNSIREPGRKTLAGRDYSQKNTKGFSAFHSGRAMQPNSALAGRQSAATAYGC